MNCTRRARAQGFTAFRATASRAAFQHDDLTLIYPGDAGSALARDLL